MDDNKVESHEVSTGAPVLNPTGEQEPAQEDSMTPQEAKPLDDTPKETSTNEEGEAAKETNGSPAPAKTDSPEQPEAMRTDLPQQPENGTPGAGPTTEAPAGDAAVAQDAAQPTEESPMNMETEPATVKANAVDTAGAGAAQAPPLESETEVKEDGMVKGESEDAASREYHSGANAEGDGDEGDEGDEDGDDDGEYENDDQAEAMERRPPGDNDWQPPKKRRRKPEPMKPFNDMLYELLAFRAREGHCRVPLDSKSALGRWVANLRTQKSNLRKGYHSLDLNNERLAVLDSVGFVWDLQQFDSDARWKRQFEELLAFKNEHGHCNVPQSTPLGKWVKMQRENYRETQLKASGQLPSGRSKPRPTLSQFRIDQLETLGFNWKVAAPAVGWEHRFQELLDYRRAHGDCNVPQAWPENRQLGRWVMKQRCQYTLRQKNEKNQLSDERVQRLEEIGFSWTAPSFRKKGKDGGPEPYNAPVPQLGPPHMMQPQPQHHPHPQALPPHDFRRLQTYTI